MSQQRITLHDLSVRYQQGLPITMMTAFDFPSAQIAEAAGVELVLMGDSAAMTVLGYESTVAVSVDELLTLTKAVRRGMTTPLLVGDLPFGSYEVSNEQAILTAQRFVKEAGCDAIKLEGSGQMAARVEAICNAGIPVIGHIGFTPQTSPVHAGLKAAGRTATSARRLIYDAVRLQSSGCFAIVIEAVPSEIAKLVVDQLSIPTIGIGAGPSTDGQVLVFHDLVGLTTGHTARFVKKYGSARTEMEQAVKSYVAEVRNHEFPKEEHCYNICEQELAQLREVLGSKGSEIAS